MTTDRFAFLASLLLAFPAFAGDITGTARIIDGDTIEAAGERIRLHGIDAPESKQTCEWPGKTIPCGRLATLALMDLTAALHDVQFGHRDGPLIRRLL
jgi:endonuclease YncB( thermonuclease family)